ncbi:MAG: hypothetical protein IPP45_16275 [Sphingomonadales bacterium]|nr:hypothetical protein [Sphingomonadales bacterium]
MTPWMIWAAALVAYVLFQLWYDNWSGPLKPAEVDAFLADIEGRYEGTGNSPEVMRAFLEADDGREFVMVNLVKAQMDQVKDPASGQMVQGFELLKRYSKRFMPVLFRNGGHPGIVGRKVGGYVDAWNTEPDPGWTIFGLMRYRSRRDMMKLVMDPAFKDTHPEKILGTLATFSFPAQRVMSFYLSPRVTVALMLALFAALAHIALLTFGS